MKTHIKRHQSSKMLYRILKLWQKLLAISAFSDKFEFLVKSKMAAILATILDDVAHPQLHHNPFLLYGLVCFSK